MQHWITPSTVIPAFATASKRRTKRISFWQAAMLFSAFAVLSWALFDMRVHALGLPFEVVSAILGLWLLGVICWWNRRRGGPFDPFEFPTWVSINLYLQVVANVWLLQRDYVLRVPWLLGSYETIMPIVVALFGVALTAMWIGYVWAHTRFGSYRRLRLRPLELNQSATLVIWSIGTAASLVAILIAGQSYLGTASQESLAWTNYFWFAAILANTASTALAIKVFRTPTTSGWVWLVASLTLSLLLALLVGTKGFALVLVWLLMCYFYARKRFPKKLLLSGLILVILYVPMINTYREKLHSIEVGKGVGISDRLQSLGTAASEVLTSPLGDLLENTNETFKERQGSILEVTASVLVMHPAEKPYVGVDMIQYLLPSLVPRIIWPAKPSERWPMYFATTTYMAARTEYTFTALGLVADCYRAAGWPFVVTFFMLFGVLGARLYQAGPGSNKFAGTVFYLFMITWVLVLETELISIIIRLLTFAPLILLCIRFLLFHRPASAPPQLIHDPYKISEP